MERVAFLEKNDAEQYRNAEPVHVKTIYDAFLTDYTSAKAEYLEKRMILTGVISKIRPNVCGA